MKGKPYSFAPKVKDWIISKEHNNPWLREASFGDNCLRKDDNLLLQRAFRPGVGNGFIIQTIGIRKKYYRQGYTKAFLQELEQYVKDAGYKFILIESILNPVVEHLAESLGYEHVDNGGFDYIKIL